MSNVVCHAFGVANLINSLNKVEINMVNPYRSLIPATVGFDRLFSTISGFDDLLNEGKKITLAYPPYNIIKTNDTNYQIEIAVAGFKRDELNITVENSKLVVIGIIADSTREFLHKGIGTRNFTHNFTLSDTIAVISAKFEDGLLIIDLENIIPEEMKLRTIPILN